VGIRVLGDHMFLDFIGASWVITKER
jgi:hypothetical protein